MGTYSNSGNFDASGSFADAYTLSISATTTAVSGGTRVDIEASVTMFRNPGQPAWGTGSKSWSLPGGRLTSTSGSAGASGSGSWAYDFRNGNTTNSVYGGFSRFVPYSQGSSTTLSVSAAGSGSSFLTSRTVSVSVPLFAEPIPPVPAPSSPSNLSISSRTRTSLDLSWTASTGTVNRYRVYRDGSDQGTTTGTSFSFSGLSADTSYTLGVRAEGPDANSSIVSTTGTTLPNTFTVPDVFNQINTTAVTNLTNAGFGSVTQTPITAGATQSNNRRVLEQAPLAGTTATAGNTATIKVYSFERTVPNIVGLTQSQAQSQLSASGFSNFASSLRTSGATLANNKLVATQSPASGTSLNIADEVSFQINDYRIAVPNLTGLSRQTAIDTLSAAGFTKVTITTTETGATPTNNNKVFSQSPVNSGTTYNPADQTVSFVVYTLGVVGKRMTSATTSELLTNSLRFDGTQWTRTLTAKRFNGTAWEDIA